MGEHDAVVRACVHAYDGSQGEEDEEAMEAGYASPAPNSPVPEKWEPAVAQVAIPTTCA